MAKSTLRIANKPYPLYEGVWINNMKELVKYTSSTFGDKNAFSWEEDDGKEVNVSFIEFKKQIDALGAVLYSKNIKNERIAILGESSYLWILSYFAGAIGGNAIVPLDKGLSVSQMEVLVKDSEAGVLIYSEDFKDIAEEIKSEKLKIKWNMKTDITPMIEEGKKLVSENSPFAKEYIDFKLDNEKMAVIIYTSGTTGISKGVMLTQKNLMTDVNISAKYIYLFGRTILVLPLHHSFAFTTSVLAEHYYGCDVAINKSLKNVLADLQKFKPSNLFLVPLFVETFYKRIWQGAEKQKKDKLLKTLIKVSNFLLKLHIDLRRVLFKSVLKNFGGNLDLIVSGGAPIDEKYIDGFRELGVNIVNGYGITECSPVVSVNRNGYSRKGSIGLVLPQTKVKIFDKDEKGFGEICVQGDIVMLGYYNNPEATKEAFIEDEDGKWFRTGDIGWLDEDNFLFIGGRKKNLIILSNGENVSPEGLEQDILNEFPYVKEVVCFQKDNVIVAEAFFNNDYIAETGTNDVNYREKFEMDIVEFNRKQPPQKNIGKTIVREVEFPKTTTMKIKRNYK